MRGFGGVTAAWGWIRGLVWRLAGAWGCVSGEVSEWQGQSERDLGELDPGHLAIRLWGEGVFG